jgi:tetratricopeptide (TPR) repeat protein
MVDLKAFQEAVKEYCDQAFIVDRVSKKLRKATQADLAAQSGMSAADLSRKLNGCVKFQERDVRNIVRTLAFWEAITSKGQAVHLLNMMACPHFDQVDWRVEPLNKLKLNEEEMNALTKLMSDQQVETPGNEDTAQQQFQPPFDEELLMLPAHFVGREEDLLWLQSRLRVGGTTSVTALGGMGGIGKTALAARAVRRMRAEGHYRDGIVVELCMAQTDANKVVRRVLGRFDQQRREPETNDLSALIDAAHRLLDGRDALVVLDNVEPGLDIERVVIPLRAASTTVLLTARQKLPRSIVAAEASWSLDLLPLTVAIDLFTRSFGRQTPQELSLTAYAAVENIVKALDRHTLAVKLAGAYAMDCKRDLQKLSKELQDPQQALELPDGETPRAVALAFARSADALPRDARKLFVALAAFGTVGFGRRAALALGEALGLVSSGASLDLLVRRALVEVSVNDEMPERTDRERQRFHPLIRAFAAREFESWIQDERNVAYWAIAAYYSQYADKLPNAALSIDEMNVIGALEWTYAHGESALVAILCSCMHAFWHDRARTIEMLHYLPWGMTAAEAISGATNQREDRLRAAKLALTYAQVLRDVGKLDEAEQRLLQLRDIFLQELDQQGEGEVLTALGQIARLRGRLEEAGEYYEQSLPLSRMVQDRRGEGTIPHLMGRIAEIRGQLKEAEAYYEQGLAIFHEIQDRRSVAWRLCDRGRVAHTRSQLEHAKSQLEMARSCYEQSLALFRQVHDRQGEAEALMYFGWFALTSGELDDGSDLLQQALTIHREVEYKSGECLSLSLLSEIALARGQYDIADDLFTQSLYIARAGENRLLLCRLLSSGTFLAKARGDLERAEVFSHESRSILVDIRSNLDIASAILSFSPSCRMPR